MLGQHLADLGAEVVKVEWYKRFDLYRTRGVERLRGTLPENVRRESSYSFQSLNRNKLGFAADLKTDTGLDLVKDLICESDLLIENFTVGTLDRLGLDPATLEQLNETLTVVSLSATGRGSPLESLRSYGLMLSALGGYESRVTDERGDFLGSPTFVMSDPNAALFGVLASLAGALHARETGHGATFECSQVEAVASLVAAPSYPGRTTPDEADIFQTADGDFVAVSPGGGPVAGLGTSPLEPATVANWVAQTPTVDVTSALVASGGVATIVRDLGETENSQEFAGTEVRQATLHPVSGPRAIVATPWRVNGQRSPMRKPAPTIGESNQYVLRSILGLDETQIAELADSGVLDE